MGSNFEVVNVTKRVRFKRGGEAYEVYEVEFQTASGVHDSIDVLPEEYYPEKVKAIIEDFVERHEKIMNLGK